MTSETQRSMNSNKKNTNSEYGVLNTILTIISVSIVVATLLTLWTPSNLLSNNLIDQLILKNNSDQQTFSSWPTLTPGPRPYIGIVAGHYGNDSGAVCPDGLTEMELNLKIATLVKQYLIQEGYNVDLLEEFDSRLYQYQALALISIHNDSCDYINDEATGFKVAAAQANVFPEKVNRLTACLIDRYETSTGLRYHPNTITPDTLPLSPEALSLNAPSLPVITTPLSLTAAVIVVLFVSLSNVPL